MDAVDCPSKKGRTGVEHEQEEGQERKGGGPVKVQSSVSSSEQSCGRRGFQIRATCRAGERGVWRSVVKLYDGAGTVGNI